MDLEYYTLAQAARRLGVFEDEILHLVETRKLNVCLYSPSRKYIVCSETNSGVVGHAVCWYSGLIGVHPTWISKLLESKRIVVGVHVGLLTPKKITAWTTEHGYEPEADLRSLFARWEPRERHEIDLGARLLARPYGDRVISVIYQASMLAKVGVEILAERTGRELSPVQLPGLEDPNKWSFDYTKNGMFTFNDIRLEHQVLGQPLKPSAIEFKQEVLVTIKRRRVKDWHVVLERAICENPSGSPRELLALLAKDSELDEPRLDPTGVLDEIHPDCLYLASKGAEDGRRIDLKTIQNTVQKIKKERHELGHR